MRSANNCEDGHKKIIRIPHFNSVIVYIRYTSNTAACYDNHVNDATSLPLFVFATFQVQSTISPSTFGGRQIGESEK